MADILKLNVNSQEYDQKLKRATESLQKYADECRKAGGTLEHLDEGVLEFVQALGKMDTVATGTKQQLREMSNSLTTLTTTYRGLTDEEKSSPFGQELAKQIQVLTERAGQAKDAMMDVEQSIKNAASDTRTFDQLAQGMTFMTSSFQTATGAAKLFGIQMGDNVKVIADLQAAMAVTSGLTQLQNLLQKQSALMQGVNALQAEFNLLAKANPYVLLATSAAAVVTAYVAWTSSAREAERAQKSLNVEIENTRNQLSQIDKDTDFSVGIAEASGKSWKAIHELRLEAARTKLQIADMNLDNLMASGNASSEQIKEAQQMSQQAWEGVMKVLNEGTIHDVQMKNKKGGSHGRGVSSVKEDTNYAVDSIMAQEKEVQRLTDQWNRASGAMREGILRDLDAARQKLEDMKNENKPIEGGELGDFVVKGDKMRSVNKSFSEAPTNFDSINEWTIGVKDALKNADLGSDLYNNLTEKLKDANTMTQVLQQAMASGVAGADIQSAAEELKKKLLAGDIDDDAWQEMLDKLNEKITDSDLKLVFDVDTKSIETAAEKEKKQTQEMAKEWNAAGNAIQAVGNAMNQIQDPTAKVLGTVAQAVATMALSYSQAAASPAVTSTGWGWIAFAATGLATMISSVNAIKQAAEGYADGGIIKGTSYSGDNIMANGGSIGLNAGEIVLNHAQQNVLASELNGGVLSDLQLDTLIEGEDLKIVLNTNGRRTGKGEYLQSNRRR